MRNTVIAVSLVACTGVVTGACATKGFVRTQVNQVSGKVDTLGQSLEETQTRTQNVEARIVEVDAKSATAQSAADAAGATAATADTKAGAAATAAMTANAKADEVDRASRRIVEEVVLNEDEGNFKIGTSLLPDAAKAKIDLMVTALKADPKGAYFEIEGHTDNRGGAAYNERLGLDRAEAVKQYLYSTHQIPLHRMNVISYGDTKPSSDNTTRAGRAQNRRVVIRIIE
jgi:peptidoglycan-associated lipoprotein